MVICNKFVSNANEGRGGTGWGGHRHTGQSDAAWDGTDKRHTASKMRTNCRVQGGPTLRNICLVSTSDAPQMVNDIRPFYAKSNMQKSFTP